MNLRYKPLIYGTYDICCATNLPKKKHLNHTPLSKVSLIFIIDPIGWLLLVLDRVEFYVYGEVSSKQKNQLM